MTVLYCYLWYTGNSNKELWQYVSPQGAVLEGVRATVANRLAGDGDSWTSIFSRWLQLLSTRDPGVNSVVQVQQRHLQQPVDGGQHEPLHSPGNK